MYETVRKKRHFYGSQLSEKQFWHNSSLILKAKRFNWSQFDWLYIKEMKYALKKGEQRSQKNISFDISSCGNIFLLYDYQRMDAPGSLIFQVGLYQRL